MKALRHARSVRARWKKKLHALPNVVSVGVGEKIKNKQLTGEIAVIVNVRKKVSIVHLPPEDRVPTRIEGIVTDVVETNEFGVWPPLVADRRDRIRPIRPGYSIGNKDITAGTFGCVVTDPNNGDKFILSNAHVLTSDPTKQGSSPYILQPGPYDGGVYDADLVAHLEDYMQIGVILDPSQCPVSTTTTKALTNISKLFRRQSRFYALAEQDIVNRIDAAIAKPEVEMESVIEGIGTPVGVFEGEYLNARVMKSGRTTGVTHGWISQIDVSIAVNYGMQGPFPRMAYFEGQLIISSEDAFSQGGDSGSLILAEGEQPYACGLLFAGSQDGKFTVANPIAEVLATFGVYL